MQTILNAPFSYMPYGTVPTQATAALEFATLLVLYPVLSDKHSHGLLYNDLTGI